MWKIPKIFSTEKGVKTATKTICANSFVPAMITSLEKVEDATKHEQNGSNVGDDLPGSEVWDC